MISELHLYHVFYTVAQYQSFSQAAKALYISQPAVSKSIKALESSLGTSLFSRRSKGISLTPEGELFYKHVQTALEALEEGEKLLLKLHSLNAGQINLGVSSTLGTHFLMPLLKSFMERYPHIKLQIINDSTTKTLDLAKKGVLDIVIVSSSNYYDGLSFIPLKKIEDIFVCSPSYYESISSLTLPELCEQASFMFLSKDSVTRLYLETVLANQGISIVPDIVAGDMNFLISCAKLGLGITSVIKDFVSEELATGSLVEIPFTLSPSKRSIDIAYATDTTFSKATSCFIDFLNQELL